MSESANRSEVPALGLTLATLLCVTALADISAGAVVLPVQRDGVTLSDQRRALAERIVQHFQEWQAGQQAVFQAERCVMDAPREPMIVAPTHVTDSLPLSTHLRPHLLNLPPPGAIL